jgi:hypothetical protein
VAPQRLYPKGWKKANIHRPGWRWWLIRHTPTVFLDYTLEVLLVVVALITGLGYLTGFSSGRAIVRLLPPYVAYGYSGCLILAAVTITVGLALKRHGTIAARGLKLVSVTCLVYTISVAYYLGLASSLSVVAMSMAFCVLAGWRSFLLHSTYLLCLEDAARGQDDNTRGP